jgi:hypothetical protein
MAANDSAGSTYPMCPPSFTLPPSTPMHDTDDHAIATSVKGSESATTTPPSSSLDTDMSSDVNNYSADVSTSPSTLPKHSAALPTQAQPSSTSLSSAPASTPTTPHTAAPSLPHPKSTGGASSPPDPRPKPPAYSYLTTSTRSHPSSSSAASSSPLPPYPASTPTVPQSLRAPFPSHLPPSSHSTPTGEDPLHSTTGVSTSTSGPDDRSPTPWGEVEDDPPEIGEYDEDVLFDHLEGDSILRPIASDTPLPSAAATPSSSLFPVFMDQSSVGPRPRGTSQGTGADAGKRKALVTSNPFDLLSPLSNRDAAKRKKALARTSATREDYTRGPPRTSTRSSSATPPAASSSPLSTAPTPIHSSSTSSSSSSSSPMPSQPTMTPPTAALAPSVAALFATDRSDAPFIFNAGVVSSQLPTLPPPSRASQGPAPSPAATSSPPLLPSGGRRGGGSRGRHHRRDQEDRTPPEGKEERKDENPSFSPPSSSSSTSPPPAPASSAARGPRSKGPPATSSSRAPAPSLPGKSRAHPQPRLLDALGVPRESPTDLVATITFPPFGGRNLSTLPRPAHHSGSSMVGANNAAHLLEKSLHIPPPSLLKALSRYDTPADLLAYLQSLQGTSLLTTLTPYVAGLAAAIQCLDRNDMDAPAKVAAALYSTPTGMDAFCHSSYLDYLNPSTAIIKSFRTPAKEQRHVIRLGLNSPLVTAALEYHLTRYAALLCPAPAPAPSKAAIAGLLAWQAEWTRRSIPTSAIHSRLHLSRYEYRYESTRVSGFTRGPDCNPPLPLHDNLSEPFGSLNSFLAYLSAAAPHCYAGKVDYTPDGRAYVQLVHEMQYRSELYRINGATSPRHGISRPMRLSYYQQKVPAARCCSHCGEGDHQAHACPVKSASAPAAAAAADMDSGLPAHPPGHRAGVCRDCYSPDHQQNCDTNPASVTCKLCNLTGHTSFHCARYRAQWVPLSLPAVTLPMSTRPLVITCIQRGLAWRDIAAAAAGSPPPSGPAPPPASAFPALQPSTAARARPPAPSPASPTVSSSSLPASQPVTPTSPSSPVIEDRFNQLQHAILTMQAETKAFQQAQTQHFSQLQQQQVSFQQQLQSQLLGLQSQLQVQQQAFKDYTASVDNRFFALLQHLAPTPLHAPPAPITAFMQTGAAPPPATTSSASIPMDESTPAAAAPQCTPPMAHGPLQVSVAQSGANASVGSFHFQLPSAASPMGGHAGPPAYTHSTPQPSSSSSTPSTGRVSRPQ